jgi:hypothetical protein
MMLQKMGEMFLMGLNGACAVAGFTVGFIALLCLMGFIGNIVGLLLGGGEDDEED